VRKALQVSLAVLALLLAFVVGPETHVHQGVGPNQETVVHVHFGIVGHVHHASSPGRGVSRSDSEGRAVYLNAYSSNTTQIATLHILIAGFVRLLPPSSGIEAEFSQPEVKAHAPPLIDFTRPRSPPLNYSA
jgi:hypothetical protein